MFFVGLGGFIFACVFVWWGCLTFVVNFLLILGGDCLVFGFLGVGTNLLLTCYQVATKVLLYLGWVNFGNF